jgi:DNA-binding transcriptional ArsR family regulator
MPARTERRHAATTAATAAQRPMVRDVAGRGARVELSFERRTAYDFAISLYVAAGEESDLLPEDGAWLERARKALPEDIRTDMSDIFGEQPKGVFHSLPSIIIARPDVADATSLVHALNDLGERELSLILVESMLCYEGLTDRAERVVEGDEEAIAEARRALDERHCESLERFLENRGEKIAALRRVLDAWLPVYREIEPRVGDMLERDLARRTTVPDGEDVMGLIEATTGGVRWFPEAGVRRVIMAPIYFGRPYNYVYQGTDWRLFLYPLAEEALGPADESIPSQAVVRLYRALGDATRMRVLRLLSERDWYLTELAQQLELSKPTMKHHLALLRAAGLVTVTDQGSMTYYSLRRERVREAGIELQRYLG